ncbi:MAG: hypothetical protein QME83_19445, partial [Thermodesulfobacteriota bacterium]|nr:hypothetical protein [Thermodesulfobacteriota bacterium]
LVLEGINRGTGIQRILTIQKYWIPACAGMTENSLFRLFTRLSSIIIPPIFLACRQAGFYERGSREGL